MSTTATETKSEPLHIEEAPTTQGKAVATISTWQDFSSQLEQRQAEIAAMLPSHVSKARFMASAIAAIKQNPDLLQCTPRSLFGAVTKSAQDGLLPDGREGVITSYNTEVKLPGGKSRWDKVAQWNPMTYGLRKRAREIDGIIIDAQVVCENDLFEDDRGDEPRIVHKPAKLGTSRGPLIGVYAIFKREDGTILHREVMDKDAVQATRNQSKAKNSLMWTTFESEGWRKAAIRRGIKTVPVSEKLEQIVTREDETFDFGPPVLTLAASAPPAPPPPEGAADTTANTAPKRERPQGGPRTRAAAPPAPPPAPPSAQEPPAAAPATDTQEPSQEEEQVEPEGESVDGHQQQFIDWLTDCYKELKACTTATEVESLRERVLPELANMADEEKAWKEACAERGAEIFNAGSRKRR